MTPTPRDWLSPLWAAQAGPLPSCAAEWECLLGQARSSQLLARLALWCQQQERWAEVPVDPRRYLASALALTGRQSLDVRWEVAQLQQALRGLPGPVVLLKGAAYELAGLPAAAGRSFSDIDVMVPQAQLAQAESALFSAGWIAQERDAYNDRYYRQWMHELPPLTHVQRGSVIDLHHTITPPTSDFHVDGAALSAEARPLASMPGLCVLQPVDMVLHSAVHLFAEGEFERGLRDLLDMDLLVKHFSEHDPVFWQALLARAQELQLQRPLHHALTQLARLFGTRPPPGLAARVQALAPGWPSRMVMHWLLARALRPAHPNCRLWGDDVVRLLLYVRSHWLRMPLRLLVPHLVRKAWMARFAARPDQHDTEPAADKADRPAG